MATNPSAEERDVTQNENWTTCERCGAKLFIEPDTGEAEPCGTCQSHSMKRPLVGGVAFIGLAGFIVVMILAAAIYMLMKYL